MTSSPANFAGRLLALLLGTASITSLPAFAAETSPAGRSTAWLATAEASIEAAVLPKPLPSDLQALTAITAKRTPADMARYQWWATGGPAYRWNEIMLVEIQEAFVVLPLAARHLALFQAAIDDAMRAARNGRKQASRPDENGADSAIEAASKRPAEQLRPSTHAAAAAAASDVLAYLFPARAAQLAKMADEAMQVRMLAGAEFPQEIEAGRTIGRRVAALAVSRGKADSSDAKWTGMVPEGADKWKGTNPIAPLAGTWRPWLLSSASELRPPAPPAVDSDTVKSAAAELKAFQRTPKSNHRALYWEVHGGARAHTLWNEIARTTLLENRTDALTGARVLAALNIAMADAGVSCWDAKFAFWMIRPPQFDADVKPLFAPPNHPSYPAAHGCFSTAAATVLAGAFPSDKDRFLRLAKEAAEARVWAGIHFRFDIEAGQDIGRKVGQKALAHAFAE